MHVPISKIKEKLILKTIKIFKKIKGINYSNDKFRNKLFKRNVSQVVPIMFYIGGSKFYELFIENRSPFLDTKILELAFKYLKKLIQSGFAKWFLRKVGIQSNIIPEDIINDREK